MLCNHGVFPLEVMKRSLEERFFMFELIKREAGEVKRIGSN